MIALLVFVLVAGACGDDSTASGGGAGGDDESGTDNEDSNGGGSDGATGGAGEADAPPGAAVATVTLGGETFTADLTAPLTVCISLGGALAGSGPVDGYEKSDLSIDLPPEGWESGDDDWEPPSVRLDLGEDAEGVLIDWRAGGAIVRDMPDLEGRSQVESFSIDGRTATGTATFVDFFQFQLAAAGQVDEPESVQGTFELSCG